MRTSTSCSGIPVIEITVGDFIIIGNIGVFCKTIDMRNIIIVSPVYSVSGLDFGGVYGVIRSDIGVGGGEGDGLTGSAEP